MDFFSLIIVGLVLLSVVNSVRKKNGGKGSNSGSSRRTVRRANSAGDDGRFDRSAQRVNSVGDDGRLDREAQRANSIGESRRRRMVEEQRERAEAYRRAHGETAAETGAPRSEQSRPASQSRPYSRPACPACGRPLKPGVKFCPGCGTATAAGAAVAVSNIPADAGIFAQGVSEAAYSYSDGDRPPTEISPALPPLPKAKPSLALPGFSGPELTKALVMAEILGPCKARQHH
ncbi:MAG: zinc-ribbon domain-containing protein [Firmicutes bacterium]|nr:zinc-ribbon domain-containing protein [Bacillota bacterium]